MENCILKLIYHIFVFYYPHYLAQGGILMRLILKPVNHPFHGGECATQDFFDHRGTLLLGKGQEVNPSLASILNQQSVYNLHYDWKDSVCPELEHPLTSELSHYSQTSPWLQRIYLETDLLPQGLLLEAVRFIDQLIDDLSHHPSISTDFNQLSRYDGYTYMHSINVALLAYVIGTASGYEGEKLRRLVMGALLHDVGKLGIPLDIINKPGALSEDEFRVIQTHPLRGAHRSSELFLPENVLSTILQHHERWNGRGYPEGLLEEEIHPFAQIVAVADVFDALIADRPYRSGLPPYHAIEILLQGSGQNFSPEVLRNFMHAVQLYPSNSLVTLNSGESGVVLKYSLPNPTRPLVQILFDAHGKPVENEWTLDLVQDSTHFIHTVQYGRVS